MSAKLISYDNLDELLEGLREKGTVYAPGRDSGGEVGLLELRKEPPALEYINFPLSPKAFFLPQQQTLLLLKNAEWSEPDLATPQRFLFGVRPCDARALTLLDRVFIDGQQSDPYYARLREKTTVIGLACSQAMPSCFCTSVGGGPGDATGMDVQAVALETGLLLQGLTPKGEELLRGAAGLTADAGPEAVRDAEERIRGVEGQLAPVMATGSGRRLAEAYEAPLWEATGRKCLGCGTCSFLCPTCHCFDITDEVRGEAGRRVRTWDCCAYPQFTLHGSGHNPRPTPKERWRQRMMHKFRYAVENFEAPFCVGCGRCIRNCPVSLDLRTVLKELGA